jgi:uncharacterized C2H2 Zn-finger protein
MKCPYCERIYKTKESLEGHINANHWKLREEQLKGN